MSQGPKAFQRATIQAAMSAFDRRKRVRRFLVADEVGLGKTVVARGVIEQMMQRWSLPEKRPLRVFYMCSSLSIATQNRDSLLKVLAEKDRSAAYTDVDRLTLAPNRTKTKAQKASQLQLFTLTPGTSAPDRNGKRRDGDMRERALLRNLLAESHPDLATLDGHEWLQRQAVSSWGVPGGRGGCINSKYNKPAPGLVGRFVPVLRAELQLKPGQHLAAKLKPLIRRDPLEAIKILRVALAKTGLKHLRPDLVIFDEFQRFNDMLTGSGQESTIAGTLTQTGAGGPAVLLLSATPYKLYGGELDEAFSNNTHHEQFYGLVQWLMGSDDAAKVQCAALQRSFRNYGEALRTFGPTDPSLQRAKKAIESVLRPIIARTERFSLAAGRQAPRRQVIAAPPVADDVHVYRHTIDCIRQQDGTAPGADIATAIAYWTSVPLPMQTLGAGYQLWKRATPKPAESDRLALGKAAVDRFTGPATWPHPRLRALSKQMPPQALSIPWVAPSLPWWPLEGLWEDSGGPGKALLFSRFRAVPRAVASLMSFAVERHLLANADLPYADVTSRRVLHARPKNLAFFHPSALLATAVDPWRLGARSIAELRHQTTAQLRTALKEAGIPVTTSTAKPRSTARLIVAAERAWNTWDTSEKLWTQFAKTNHRSAGTGDKGLLAQLDTWAASAPTPLTRLSEVELSRLTTAALANPGVIIARVLARHGLDLEQHAAQALDASWNGLRSYLNNQWLASALPGSADYNQRICEAVLHGNLESVLDEHLWVTRTLRGVSTAKLGEQLVQALSLRTSDISLFDLNDQASFKVRSHAALAFTQPVRKHTPDADTPESESIRTDDVRVAFNSPFWPHVLASTSVGQEGLDFHAWCDTVVHWDLPSNPVDLEQREGRVDRYAGLATRRALAARTPLLPHDVPAGTSPWQALADTVEQQPHDALGLSPWWVNDGSRVTRVTFDVPMSRDGARFERLKRQRMLYRLTMGQPNQADLIGALDHWESDADIVSAAIDLSPALLHDETAS